MDFVLRIVCDCVIDGKSYANGPWSNTDDFELVNFGSEFLEYDHNLPKSYDKKFGNSKLFFVKPKDFNGRDKFLMRLSVRRIGIKRGIFYAWKVEDDESIGEIRAAVSNCKTVGNGEHTFENDSNNKAYFYLDANLPLYELIIR